MFKNKDGHLDLDKVCEEIVWLYKEYGLEPDENLTLDAIELKNKIKFVVDTIKNLP